MDSFDKGEFELDLEVVMFHLQQSSEKLLKVLLDYNSIRFPHSHDIEELIDLIRINQLELIDDVDQLVPLTEYAVEGRYAVVHDDLDDTGKYIKVLDELLEFVRDKIETTNCH